MVKSPVAPMGQEFYYSPITVTTNVRILGCTFVSMSINECQVPKPMGPLTIGRVLSGGKSAGLNAHTHSLDAHGLRVQELSLPAELFCLRASLDHFRSRSECLMQEEQKRELCHSLREILTLPAVFFRNAYETWVSLSPR